MKNIEELSDEIFVLAKELNLEKPVKIETYSNELYCQVFIVCGGFKKYEADNTQRMLTVCFLNIANQLKDQLEEIKRKNSKRLNRVME